MFMIKYYKILIYILFPSAYVTSVIYISIQFNLGYYSKTYI